MATRAEWRTSEEFDASQAAKYLRIWVNGPSKNVVGQPESLYCIEEVNQRPTETLIQLRDETVSTSGRSKVVFVEGSLSPSVAITLVEHVSAPPELLIGHLDLERVWDGHVLRTPKLPSASPRIVHVTFPRLFAMVNHIRTNASLFEQQRVLDDETSRQEKSMLHRRTYGDARVRRWRLLSREYLSAEQLVSMSFTVFQQPEDNWIGVVMLDATPFASSKEDREWQTIDLFKGGLRAIDTFYYGEFTEHSTGKHLSDRKLYAEAHSDTPWVTESTYHPAREFLNEQQRSTFLKHPCTLITVIMRSSLVAWGQHLNLVEHEITVIGESMADASVSSMEQLQCIIDFLNFCGRETKSASTSFGSLKNEFAAIPPSTDDSMSALRRNIDCLIQDQEYMIKRTEGLLRQCEILGGILMNAAQILEAKKSIDQARSIVFLTRLAFIFLPLNLAFAFWGMNLDQLEKTDWWWSLVTAFVLLVLSLLSMNERILEVLGSPRKLWSVQGRKTKSKTVSVSVELQQV